MKKMLLGLSLVALGLVSGPAVLAQELEECHGLTSEAERLSCYDRVSGFTESDTVSNAPEALASGGQWTEDTETSALDGRTDVWLNVRSVNTQPNQIGDPEKAYLFIRCINNSTDVILMFNNFTTENQSVPYKLDEEPIKEIRAGALRGGEGIGLPSGGESISFIRDLFDRQSLVIVYESFSNQSLEFSFDISGLSERIGDLAENCNWNP